LTILSQGSEGLAAGFNNKTKKKKNYCISPVFSITLVAAQILKKLVLPQRA